MSDPCNNDDKLRDGNDDDSDKICYEKSQHEILQVLYISAIVVWILLTACYGINPPNDCFEGTILLLPIICFAIAFCCVHAITESVEAMMLKANLLTIGLLVALPLINWSKETSVENKALFIKLAATAIILSLITLIDFWVPKKYIYLQKHIKSILQTFAIVLLIFGLYRFFCESCFTTTTTSGTSNNSNNNTITSVGAIGAASTVL